MSPAAIACRVPPHPPMARRVELLAAGAADPPAPHGASGASGAHELLPDSLRLDGEASQLDAFSAAEFVRATRRVLQHAARVTAPAGDALGVPELRERVCAQLARQGLRLTPAQVLITSGSRHALELLGRVLLDTSSPLLVQRPTHAAALQAFAPYAPRIVGLRCDDHGPLPGALESALPGARLLYLQPAAADPDGATLSAERAQQLAELLARSRCWLVEHDAQGELGRGEHAAPSLLAGGAAHGAHVGDFCGLGLPDLRLGWVACTSAPLLGALVQARSAAGPQPSGLSQLVLLELLRSGAVDRALPGLRAACRQRRDAMLDALRRHMPAGVIWNRPAAGLFVWLELPQGCDGQHVAWLAAQRGVAVTAGGACDAGAGGCDTFGQCSQCRFADDPDGAAPARNTLRLSCALLEAHQVEPAVARLAGAVREALGQRGSQVADPPARSRVFAMIRA